MTRSIRIPHTHFVNNKPETFLCGLNVQFTGNWNLNMELSNDSFTRVPGTALYSEHDHDIENNGKEAVCLLPSCVLKVSHWKKKIKKLQF